MRTTNQPASAVLNSWRKFVEKGKLDRKIIRSEIADSWLRCREAGVDPFVGCSTHKLSPAELARLLEEHQILIDVARPFMKTLYKFVESSSFVVLLCDERGYIMETVGDPEILRSSPELNFQQGALWAEEEIGNNGVGTTLFLQRPFQVSGGEHYCRKHHPWTCSGTPIRNEQGGLIGILEMSGPVEATHQHTLGMVVAAAEAIKQQISVQMKNRELTLLNEHLNNLFLTVSDGVVVVDNQGVIVQINPVAEKIFRAKAKNLVGALLFSCIDKPEPIQDLLKSGRSFNDLEMNVAFRSASSPCLASAKPIRDETGRITNGVCFLNPIHRVNKLINRYSGARAVFTFDDIIGTGKAITKAIETGIQAASIESNVLLRGESGTGKEMFAQAIHNRSARRQRPFIAINCGAIPRELIGSELFGYSGGAFTGASKHGRPGKFELAAGGTLFLDEIGDMPLDQQVSLLRVLQDKSITRIGGEKTVFVDVRIICATNKDLALEITKGNFRQDLYYRLNVLSITLPPLREMREDIPLMFKYFYEKASARLGAALAPVDPEVIFRLQQHDWPGNMREFQNVIEKIVSVPNQSCIGLNCLPEELQAPAAVDSPNQPPATVSLREHRAHIKRSLADQERRQIYELMSQYEGNLSEIARVMGISRTTLYRKLKKLGTS